ncbi:MAG TPA: hypothetical protein VD735_04015 [Candidatus Saccharimonadales bacterium]|nr:hypothetical protein [Candidatus Saccharimonadales bacterium]
MSEEIFHIQPWTPKVREAAERLMGHIHELAPELEVLFMGAAALGLPGKNDIDLDVLCSKADLKTYIEKLSPLFGKPKSVDDISAGWSFDFDGFEADVMISDPTASHVRWQRKRFEILKGNQELLAAYKKLKEASDGLPYAEYEQRKRTFRRESIFTQHIIWF